MFGIEEIDLRKLVDLSDVRFRDDGFPIENQGNIREIRYGIRPASSKLIPTIVKEIIRDKIVIHNYGHGSCGWTLLFSTVNKSVEIFLEAFNEKAYNTGKEITIIGMGVIGLVTALNLYHKGYKNIKIIGEYKNNLASYTAGGLFRYSPIKKIQDESIKSTLNKQIEETYFEYIAIIQGKHKIFNSNVRKINLYTDNTETEGIGLYNLAKKGIIPKAKKVKIILGSKLNPITMDLYKYETLLIDTDNFMQTCWDMIHDLGIGCEFRKVTSFDDIKTPVVFNCSALGSKDLAKDDSMFPIAGHGLILKNQPHRDCELDWILNVMKFDGLGNSQFQGALYFMPKNGNLFVGGISSHYEDLSDRNKYEREIAKLTKRARYCFNGILENSITPKF